MRRPRVELGEHLAEGAAGQTALVAPDDAAVGVEEEGRRRDLHRAEGRPAGDQARRRQEHEPVDVRGVGPGADHARLGRVEGDLDEVQVAPRGPGAPQLLDVDLGVERAGGREVDHDRLAAERGEVDRVAVERSEGQVDLAADDRRPRRRLGSRLRTAGGHEDREYCENSHDAGHLPVLAQGVWSHLRKISRRTAYNVPR